MAVVDALVASAKAEGVDLDWKSLYLLLDRDTAFDVAASVQMQLSGDGWRLVQSTLKTRAGLNR